ncbi:MULTISPECIES: DUF6612 family protein [unclassified Sporosarcina]|uniref:DUF6612 family protein n=1 Tax=unclassified Sporosarcina TaxID=2647733 RepID=UPI00204136E9|nr:MULTISPECIES: DUF6612 family protein [unclassified Sporosarcina]GKV65898.1 hypothetical protein NCCP2331_20510 [Sporosarcina sp. NCCP-2331]GLB56102.1 hypothetical protein NCCP2378_18890 [Sporosarcina sp. NCCP-2378]
MKKLGSWVVAFVLALAFAVPAGSVQAANADTAKLVVDGVEVAGYEQPFFSKGEVLIPVENVFNESGFKVTKNKGAVSVTNSYLTVHFNAPAKRIIVDGKKADTEFPLTLKNAGNYVTGEFLSSLEGFEVEVSEDQRTVNVTTNRVQDVDAFLEKTLQADLNSFSAAMTIDQTMEASSEEDPIHMQMDLKMDAIQNPLAMYMETTMKMNMMGESLDQMQKAYVTEDGMYQYDSSIEKWIKMDDEMTNLIVQSSAQQADPHAQLELMKKFSEGVHVFEYDDQYVMVQTLTNEQFKEMLDDIMDLLPGLIPEEVQGMMPSQERSEEDSEDGNEEGTVDEEGTEPSLDDIFAEMNLNIEEYYSVQTIDKETLFPLDLSAVTKMSLSVEDEKISISQKINGTFSNFNQIKEITIPEEVIKNAISMEEYLKELGIEEELEVEI